MAMADYNLAFHGLANERVRQFHGPTFNALYTQMISYDPSYPALASADGLRNYKQSVRRAASKTPPVPIGLRPALSNEPMSEYRNLKNDGNPCSRCQGDDAISKKVKVGRTPSGVVDTFLALS